MPVHQPPLGSVTPEGQRHPQGPVLLRQLSHLAGLALDFCVRYSAEDAHRHGFAAVVVAEACRGIDVDGSMEATRQSLSDRAIPMAPLEAVG